jgi:uncharacterized protein with von Willebrand factor type A (vWA) domain
MMIEKIDKTTQILIDFESGVVSVRKAQIVLEDGEEIARKESNNGYMPLTRRKAALMQALADRPDELSYFDKLWSEEYMAPHDEKERLRNESRE